VLFRSLVGRTNYGCQSQELREFTVWEAPTLWKVPLIVSPALAAGTFYVGDFRQSALIFTRELLTVEIAFQNEDDFIRNLACLRGELRSSLAVPVPAGILRGSFGALLPLAAAAPANAAHAAKK